MFKRKKAISISIPNPCDKVWENMLPTGKGRTCDKCANEIVDYTKYSDQELSSHLSKNSTNCGRFSNDQLNKVIHINQEGFHVSSNYKRVATAIAITTATILGSGQKTNAQSNPIEQQDKFDEQDLQSDYTIIIGEVNDQINGNPIAHAKVQEKNTDNLVLTDNNGKFEIKVKNGSELIFESDHYISQEINISNRTYINCLLVNNQNKSEEKVDSTLAIKVKGSVSDEVDFLVGVNIVEKGTLNGTVTDVDGNYEINIAEGATLVFSYVGYESKEFEIQSSNKNTMQFDVVINLGGCVTMGIIVTARKEKPEIENRRTLMKLRNFTRGR